MRKAIWTICCISVALTGLDVTSARAGGPQASMQGEGEGDSECGMIYDYHDGDANAQIYHSSDIMYVEQGTWISTNMLTRPNGIPHINKAEDHTFFGARFHNSCLE